MKKFSMMFNVHLSPHFEKDSSTTDVNTIDK